VLPVVVVNVSNSIINITITPLGLIFLKKSVHKNSKILFTSESMASKCLTTKTPKDSSSQYNQIIKLHTLIKLSVNRQHV